MRINIQTDEMRGISINLDSLPKIIYDGMIKNLEFDENKRNIWKDDQNNLMVNIKF